MIENIKKELMEEISRLVGEDKEVRIESIQKANRMEKTGLVILTEGRSATPVIYIDEVLSYIADGKSSVAEQAKRIQQAAKRIQQTYAALEETCGKIKIPPITSRDYLLAHVTFHLVNADRNTELLEGVPHRKVLDLAVVYRAMLSSTKEGSASVIVTDSLAEAAGVTLEELEEDAEKNTRDAGFATIPLIPNVCTCLTNEDEMFGANALLFKDLLMEQADKSQDDLYIVLTSIHELIVQPASILDTEFLKSLAVDNSKTPVTEEEFLSNSVYRFSRDTGEITIEM